MRKQIGPLTEISIFILPGLDLQEFIHGKTGRSTIILIANFFYDIILFGIRIVFDGPVDKGRVFKIKIIPTGIGIRIPTPV